MTELKMICMKNSRFTRIALVCLIAGMIAGLSACDDLVSILSTGDTDLTEQLRDIMEANPDVIMISALASEMITVMSQGREIGIPDSVLYIHPSLNANEVELLGDAAEGAITAAAWFGESDTPGNQRFVQRYRAQHGTDPDPWAAQSYAALHILAAAIARAGSTDSNAIRDALAETAGYDTILGKFSFDSEGEARYSPILLKVKDGQLRVFDTGAMP